jgi:hypothetical protein
MDEIQKPGENIENKNRGYEEGAVLYELKKLGAKIGESKTKIKTPNGGEYYQKVKTLIIDRKTKAAMGMKMWGKVNFLVKYKGWKLSIE